jgi:hypothetical protein
MLPERSQELEVEEREIRRLERPPRRLVRAPDAADTLDPHHVSARSASTAGQIGPRPREGTFVVRGKPWATP